jgi:hypothetical protein
LGAGFDHEKKNHQLDGGEHNGIKLNDDDGTTIQAFI